MGLWKFIRMMGVMKRRQRAAVSHFLLSTQTGTRDSSNLYSTPTARHTAGIQL